MSKSNKNSTVLLYALASAMVAISTGSHVFTHNIILLEKKPFEINANSKEGFPIIRIQTCRTTERELSLCYRDQNMQEQVKNIFGD